MSTTHDGRSRSDGWGTVGGRHHVNERLRAEGQQAAGGRRMTSTIWQSPTTQRRGGRFSAHAVNQVQRAVNVFVFGLLANKYVDCMSSTRELQVDGVKAISSSIYTSHIQPPSAVSKRTLAKLSAEINQSIETPQTRTDQPKVVGYRDQAKCALRRPVTCELDTAHAQVM